MRRKGFAIPRFSPVGVQESRAFAFQADAAHCTAEREGFAIRVQHAEHAHLLATVSENSHRAFNALSAIETIADENGQTAARQVGRKFFSRCAEHGFSVRSAVSQSLKKMRKVPATSCCRQMLGMSAAQQGKTNRVALAGQYNNQGGRQFMCPSPDLNHRMRATDIKQHCRAQASFLVVQTHIIAIAARIDQPIQMPWIISRLVGTVSREGHRKSTSDAAMGTGED